MFAPSHCPWHVASLVLHGVRAPWGAPMTATHLPSAPGTSHAAHAAEHDDSQQTPSTQNPLSHWFDAVHVAPPLRCAVQTPASQ